jgi:endoglucanase
MKIKLALNRVNRIHAFHITNPGMCLAIIFSLLCQAGCNIQSGIPTQTAIPFLEADNNQVSSERYARLSKGINLAFWFWLPQEESTNIQSRFSDEDFAYLVNLGFTYVRLPIDLAYLLDENDPDLLGDVQLKEVDTALDRLIAHGLAVILDIHSTASPESEIPVYSEKLENDPAFQQIFADFWENFARHLSSRDPELIFLELLNEPVFEGDPQDWPPILEKVTNAARYGAPRHTLLVSGAWWSNIDGLTMLEPLADGNVIYYFHFYEPMTFTHQGADWVGPDLLNLRNIPYPSSPELIQSALRIAKTEHDRQTIQYYGEERWNAEKIHERIALAADWASRYNVRVICSEFGAYSESIPSMRRAAWIYDVRTALEAFGIGWAMWEYDGDFRLITRRMTQTGITLLPENGLLEALGLKSK